VENALATELRSIRTLKGLSLKRAATDAEISTAYLQKLEGGEVQQPSPHVLHRLAAVLDVPYGTLMQLAGYVVPTGDPVLAGSAFDHALNTNDLTDDERKAVAAFIAHLRAQRD
jgi:transcriptional regulator with XRE-family HTH domain